MAQLKFRDIVPKDIHDMIECDKGLKFRGRTLLVLIALCLMLGCKSDRLIINFCDPLAGQCDIEKCEKFQDAIIMIQLSYDGYDISLYKVTRSVKYLEDLTGIKSNIYSYEIPVYSSRDELLKDIEAWVIWFDQNVCKQPLEENIL